MTSVDYNELSYSVDANAARYKLLKELNEINIFVEDTYKEYEYEEIFERLLENQYKIKNIFAAGGKKHLEERFDEFGEFDIDNTNSLNFYIADGDFDRIIYKDSMQTSKHFIYLNSYNIENYYVDENAIIVFLRGCMGIQKAAAKAILKYDNWIENILEDALTLFFCYCYIQKYYPETANVANSPGKFIDSKTGFIREDKLYEYIGNFQQENDIDKDSYNQEICNIREACESVYGDNLQDFVCGKFLLHSLGRYLSSVRGKTIDDSRLRWDLIREFDIEKIRYIQIIIDDCYKKEFQG